MHVGAEKLNEFGVTIIAFLPCHIAEAKDKEEQSNTA